MSTTSEQDAPLVLEERDVFGDEGPDKIRRALARFRLVEARAEASFALGYDTLWREFGPKNEIENRPVLQRWFHEGSLQPQDAPIRAHYHLVLAFDTDGQLAGLRDGFSAVDAQARRVVAFLSHSLVLPHSRRSGVATLLRAAPAVLARQDALAAGLDPARVEVLLVAEMEHVVPEAKDSVVRLVAYGRAGFRVLLPELVPYAQPDFRAREELPGGQAVPLPFSLLVRQVDREDRAELPAAAVDTLITALQVIHATSVVQDQLPLIRATALGPLQRSGRATVPLLALPRTTADVAELAPLLQSRCLPHYPRAWWNGAVPGDPADELARLVANWSTREPSPTRSVP